MINDLISTACEEENGLMGRVEYSEDEKGKGGQGTRKGGRTVKKGRRKDSEEGMVERQGKKAKEERAHGQCIQWRHANPPEGDNAIDFATCVDRLLRISLVPNYN